MARFVKGGGLQFGLLRPRIALEEGVRLLPVGIGVVAVVIFALGSDTRVAMRGSMFARCLGKKLLGGFSRPALLVF